MPDPSADPVEALTVDPLHAALNDAGSICSPPSPQAEPDPAPDVDEGPPAGKEMNEAALSDAPDDRSWTDRMQDRRGARAIQVGADRPTANAPGPQP
jgi:hypothetical protein